MAKGWNDVHHATPGAVCDALTEPDIPFDEQPPEHSTNGARGRRKKQVAVPSEDALALDFAARHADELRFVSFWGKWLKWTAERWQVERTRAPNARARRIANGPPLGGLRA